MGAAGSRPSTAPTSAVTKGFRRAQFTTKEITDFKGFSFFIGFFVCFCLIVKKAYWRRTFGSLNTPVTYKYIPRKNAHCVTFNRDFRKIVEYWRGTSEVGGKALFPNLTKHGRQSSFNSQGDILQTVFNIYDKFVLNDSVQ